MRLTSVDLYWEDNPSFDVLRQYGWVHPLSPQGAAIPSMLTYDVGQFRFTLVRELYTIAVPRGKRPFSDSYVRLFLQPLADAGVTTSPLRGQGTPSSLAEVFEALQIVEMMLQGAADDPV